MIDAAVVVVVEVLAAAEVAALMIGSFLCSDIFIGSSLRGLSTFFAANGV